jgi:hypothetical protein
MSIILVCSLSEKDLKRDVAQVEGSSGVTKKGGHMQRPETHKVLMAVLLGAGLFLTPATGWGTEGVWLDEITTLVMDHQHFAKLEGREAAYEPYLQQLQVARKALGRGDTEGVYVAMNRFMDMLEHAPEAGGIPVWSANVLFDFCGEVTPPMYHDLSRHRAKESVQMTEPSALQHQS